MIIRSILAGIAGTSRRVRSLGWAFAGLGLISAIIFIWSTNEFIQRHQASFPSTNLYEKFQIYERSIFGLLVIPLLEWVSFLICVGVSNERNPFNRQTLGLGSLVYDGHWNWMEERLDQENIERVLLLDDESGIEVETRDHEGDQSINGRCDQYLTDDDDDDDEADPDDIQDMPVSKATVLTPGPLLTSPPPSHSRDHHHLRNRTSWGSRRPTPDLNFHPRSASASLLSHAPYNPK